MDNKLPMVVFEPATTEGNIARAVAGEKIGTLVARRVIARGRQSGRPAPLRQDARRRSDA